MVRSGRGTLKKYLAQKDDLHAGRKPRLDAEGVTVKLLCNNFTVAKRSLVDSGELTTLTWGDYKTACDEIVAAFGKNRVLPNIGPEDFAKLRERMAQKWGPHRLAKTIQFCRSVFKYAYDSELLDRPVRFGASFRRPSKKVIRLHRGKQGAKLFTAEENRRLIESSTLQLRAMILLGINCGLGNSDGGNLPQTALDLERGILRVDAEIQALAQGGMPTAQATPTPPKNGQASAKRPVAKASSGTSASAPAQPLSLPRLLLAIVGAAQAPLTTKQLTEEVVRRKYLTTSKNLAALVDTRIQELLKKGLVRRPKDQSGIIAVRTSTNGQASIVKSQPSVATKPAQKPAQPVAPKAPATAKPAKKVAKPASAKTPIVAASNTALPLSAVITKILSESTEPIPARELGERVLATGYQTRSKDFINVIWVAVSKLDDVENIAGRGYRLNYEK